MTTFILIFELLSYVFLCTLLVIKIYFLNSFVAYIKFVYPIVSCNEFHYSLDLDGNDCI